MTRKKASPKTPAGIRDRIKELRRIRAGDLHASPKNWRTHPREQVAALQGALREIGYADALLARELPDGSLELIDGHARQSLDENQVVPVLVTDLDEHEAARLLVTLDPLAAMAEADTAALERLLGEVESADPGLQALLDRLAAENGIALGDDQPATDSPAVPMPAVLQIVVQCESESQQQELFERLQQEGYSCRLLTL